MQYPRGVKIVEERKVFFLKIGHDVKDIAHREITSAIKTVMVRKYSSDRYFTSILTENNLFMPAVSVNRKILGIGVGLTHLAATSDGSRFDNAHRLKQAEMNLEHQQQKLSSRVKDSSTRNKARIFVGKAMKESLMLARIGCNRFLEI